MTVLVAGGGIGGLAAALALARGGWDVTVLERASAFGEAGAGIQLGPNAFACFDALGLGAAVRAMAVFIDRLRLMDALTGAEIAQIPLDAPFRARFGNPYAVVHRGDLHGVFLRACQAHPRIALRTGCEVVGYAQSSAGVQAHLAGGAAVPGQALIGADGLRSRVREAVVGDGPPKVSGHTTYRSVIPAPRVPEALRWNAATLWAGPKCHVVHYPLSGGTAFNLVVTFHDGAAAPAAGLPATEAEVMHGFRHVHPSVQDLVRLGADWRKWVLCDREPTERWTDGRVALLGDAAHPTLQYLAQGACMAMEDAVCLARHLTPDAPAAAALDAYRRQRSLRTARVVLQSRAVGEHIYHPAGVHALLRNAILSAKTPAQFYDDMAWLYGSSGLAA